MCAFHIALKFSLEVNNSYHTFQSLPQSNTLKMSSLKSDDEDYSYSMIVMVHDTLDVIAFIAIGTACALTLSYLNNLSLAKKCLLLYLYKDVISCCLCLRSFRMIEALLSYYDVNGTSKTLAIVLSFGLSLCVFYLCLLLIFVSVFKLYMAKSIFKSDGQSY